MKQILMTGLLAASLAAAMHAQAPRAFDTASIKRTTSTAGPRVVAVSGGRLTAPFATLKELVQAAYRSSRTNQRWTRVDRTRSI